MINIRPIFTNVASEITRYYQIITKLKQVRAGCVCDKQQAHPTNLQIKIISYHHLMDFDIT